MGEQFTTLDHAMGVLGFTDFKSLDQERSIYATLRGHDVFTIMPTGGGKSACFIIPTLVKGWLTVVISPLKALIDNQVMQNRANGIPCHALHGGITDAEKAEVALEAKLRNGKPMLIYTTPETALTDWFRKRFGGSVVDLLAIDEVHCVSYWGETFRPEYMRIDEIVRRLDVKQIASFTATADTLFIQDIHRFVPFKATGNELVEIVSNPYRENLQFVKETPGSNEQSFAARDRAALQRLKQVLVRKDEFRGPTLIYCGTRRMTAELMQALAKPLARKGYTPLQYHAGMPAEDKLLSLKLFLQRPAPVVFCTNAFGMGIDRADVRMVIHYDVPDNLVSYAQECGRAGRDGLPSLCLTFFHARRLDKLESQVKFDIPQAKFVEWVYKRLAKSWLETPKERRGQYNLSHFTSTLERARAASIEGDDDSSVRRLVESVNRSLVALRKAKVIVEDEHGFRIKKMKPGMPTYDRMLEHTKTAERRKMRESGRVKSFFSEDSLNQERLWELILAKD